MQKPHTTTLAKVAFKRIPGVRGASPLAHKWLYGFGQRPHALCWEHGGYAEGGGGLFLALGAVADVDCEGFGEGGVEGDCAALAGDFGVFVFVFGFSFGGWSWCGGLMVSVLGRENTTEGSARCVDMRRARDMRCEIW